MKIDTTLIRLDKDPTLHTLARQIAYQAVGVYAGALDNWAGKQTTQAEIDFAKLCTPAQEVTPTPSKVRQVNKAGIELIQHFESCLKKRSDGRYDAYPDVGYGWDVATIGWGSTYYPGGTKVRKGDIITQAKADELFAWELSEKGVGVAKLVKVPLTDDQFAALTSFAYNVGLGTPGGTKGLAPSTLLKLLNAGDYKGAAERFGDFRKSNGKVEAGLVRRRASERNLFLSRAPFVVI